MCRCVCVCVLRGGLAFVVKSHTHTKLWVIIILVYDLSTFRAASLEFCLLRRTAQGELSPRCLCVCVLFSFALAALNFNLILLYVCVRAQLSRLAAYFIAPALGIYGSSNS